MLFNTPYLLPQADDTMADASIHSRSVENALPSNPTITTLFGIKQSPYQVVSLWNRRRE
jgi:hypothetical protein